MHLDPSIYLIDDESKLSTSMPVKAVEPEHKETVNESEAHDENDSNAPASCSNHSPADEFGKVADTLQSTENGRSDSADKGFTLLCITLNYSSLK